MANKNNPIGPGPNEPVVADPIPVTSRRVALTMPIVMERAKLGKSKKKKKKYTAGTKPLQRFMLGVSSAGSRSANSVAKGFRIFVKRSKKSARRRRDGMIRDSLRNASIGYSEGVSEFGRAPYEIARRISTGRVWRVFRAASGR